MIKRLIDMINQTLINTIKRLIDMIKKLMNVIHLRHINYQ